MAGRALRDPGAPEQDLHEEFFGHAHATVITARRGWHMPDFREIWAYRELLWVLALRDIRVRYKQAVLGAAWAVIRPLLQMLIFTLLFGKLAKIPSDGVPYPVFVFAGLLPWTFFATIVGASANSLVASSNLVSKVYFPRLIVPAASMGSALLDFCVSLVLLLALVLWYGLGWSSSMLLAPLLVLAMMVLAFGLGTFLAALSVTYRDVAQVVPFAIQLWMFATPVIYPTSFIPEQWRWVLLANPMTGYTEAFRASILGQPVDWGMLGISVGISLLLLGMGVAYFQRVEQRFADVI